MEQRSQSSRILEQALKMDLEEKKEAIELIGTAIEDMTKSSRELKREIEGKEILEIAENDEEDHSSHKNSTIFSHFEKKSNTDDDEEKESHKDKVFDVIKNLKDDSSKIKKVVKIAEAINKKVSKKDAEPKKPKKVSGDNKLKKSKAEGFIDAIKVDDLKKMKDLKNDAKIDNA